MPSAGEAQKIMTPDTFATQPVRPRDQLEAWREWYQPVLDILSKHPTGDEFPAEIHIWTLGGLAMSRTIAPPVHVVRTKSNLRRDPVDHWVISYCARGAHLAQTAGTELEVPARVPFLWSLGQEFLHERTHVDRVQFFLSRDAFRDIAPLLDAACGSTLDTPSRTSARRLHDGPRATTAGRDGGRSTPPYQRGWRDGRGGGRPIGRAGRRCQAANRCGPQGAGAAGRPQAPTDADLRADDPVPACRNVPIQSLSAVRRHGRCRPIHSAAAAARSACGPDRSRDQKVDLGDRRGFVLRRCVEFQPHVQTRVRP